TKPHPKREKERGKKNNKQKPPNTLLSSQTTDFLLCHPVLGQPHQLNRNLAGKSSCFILAYFIRSEATSPA
ncbi:hypothetical protein, partial [Mycolicibacterium peregrinum]|uniref:hypothetical protein n=1 Tax=Mycolicibacterium peregrinum TaxID=43304 RepID=UPI00197F8912